MNKHALISTVPLDFYFSFPNSISLQTPIVFIKVLRFHGFHFLGWLQLNVRQQFTPTIVQFSVDLPVSTILMFRLLSYSLLGA